MFLECYLFSVQKIALVVKNKSEIIKQREKYAFLNALHTGIPKSLNDSSSFFP